MKITALACAVSGVMSLNAMAAAAEKSHQTMQTEARHAVLSDSLTAGLIMTSVKGGIIAAGIIVSAGKNRTAYHHVSGRGDTDSYATGGYLRWQEKAIYADGILIGSHFSNRLQSTPRRGPSLRGQFHQQAMTISAEIGRHLMISRDFSLVPYARVYYSRLSPVRYHLSDGLHIRQYGSDSATGELGSRLNMDTVINGVKISPFFNIGVSRELVKRHRRAMNNQTYPAENEAATGKYQIGATAQLTEDTLMSGSLGYCHGDKQASPFTAYIGLTVAF